MKRKQSKKKSKLKRKYKDMVFTDLFSDPKNQLELYNSLHPNEAISDKTAITQITLRPIFVNDIYNDLGLLINGTLMMFVEAQSTWSPNIIPRLLMYYSLTLYKHINKYGLDSYSSGTMKLSNFEFYAVYTGEKQNIPEAIKFSEEFFEGHIQPVEIEVKIIYDKGNKDILGQYITFCKTMTRQLRQDSSIESALHAIDECIKGDILSEYLTSKRTEVASKMRAMYTREEYDKLRINNSYKEGLLQGTLNTTESLIQKYMMKHNVSLEDALDALDIPKEEWVTYKALINKKN